MDTPDRIAQLEQELAANLRRAFDTDLAAVLRHQAVRDGQAQAGAFLRFAGHPEKLVEDAIMKLSGDAGTLVTDRD